MERLKFIVPVLLVLSIASIASIGCASLTGGSTGIPLAGTQWRLQSLGPNGAEQPPVAGTNVTIEFPSEGQVSGDSSCNSYSGTYQIRDGKITFGDMITTLRACADESANQQEQEYLQALASADKIEQSGDRLIIRYDNAQSALHFVRAAANANPPANQPPAAQSQSPTTTAAFENKEWVLVSFGVSGSETSVVAGSRPTLTATNGQVAGSTGCNSFSGAYKVENDKISFGTFIMTEKACLDPGIMQQEQKYLQALESAEMYELQDNRFVITYEGGHSQLNFQSAG